MTDFTLTATRIVLRRMQAADAPVLYAYRSLPEVARYQDWLPHDLDEVQGLARAQADVEPGVPGSWLQLIIARRDDGEVVGDCGILFPAGAHASPELGIALRPDHRSRGYATCATRLMLEHLFDARKVHRVVARTDPRNLPSVAVLQRLGLRQEAHLRRSHWHRGQWVDDMVFAMLDEEWERERKRLLAHCEDGGA